VQLQAALPKYTAQGFGVATISYDSVDILQTFGKRVGITYTMLSDPDSQVIREFGILNTDVPKTSPQFGIPHPGMFIVDPNGKIIAKYFEEDYRERFTPDTILTRQFSVGGGRHIEIKTEHLTITASLSQERARAGNRITLTTEIALPPKMHIYAPGVEGYRPVGLTIEPNPELVLHPPAYPQPKIVLLPAIKERVPVYEGIVRITRDFTISSAVKSPKVEVNGRLDYQACDDQICYVPKSVPMSFTVDIDALDRERVPEVFRRKAPGNK